MMYKSIFNAVGVVAVTVFFCVGCENRETCIKKCNEQYKRCEATSSQAWVAVGGCIDALQRCKKECLYDFK